MLTSKKLAERNCLKKNKKKTFSFQKEKKKKTKRKNLRDNSEEDMNIFGTSTSTCVTLKKYISLC